MEKSIVPTQTNGLEIAVIGMSGRFPGAKNVAEFWQNLSEGRESVRFFSDSELKAEGVSQALLNDRNYVRAKAILDHIDMFDASFFGLTPREAELMDPQHRLFLECAWEALENAGYSSDKYANQIGLYAGSGTNTYYLFNIHSNPDVIASAGDLQTAIGNEKDHLSTLTSYKLNLGGPSLTIQTTCSTSLVAIHLACKSLLGGECDVALAGGVSLSVPQKTGYLYQEGGIFSSDGHCRAFDARAGGTVMGSGVGVVVLKRLEDALADEDYIHAVIKGSAVNNDGAWKAGYTAPGVEGQARVIRMAHAVAEVEPETISYIETHGTGTPLGDPIEISALTRVFRAATEEKRFCSVGSVKTNIGHLDAASGVAGFIKAVLALEHKQLPPSLHFEQPNPHINFDESPFYVNTTLKEWQTDKMPRRAGVSSFGIGGTNAHIIIEEAPAREPARDSAQHLLLISAKTRSALETATTNLVEHLRDDTESTLADIAYSLQVGRRRFSHRRTLVCSSKDDAGRALAAHDQRRVSTVCQDETAPPIMFMFPGQGSQYVNMGAGLYQGVAAFRVEVDSCSELLKEELGLDLRDLLYPSQGRIEAAAEQLAQTSHTQAALFVTEYALARMWIKAGVVPRAMIGHSIGEYVAACIAGVFSLKDALRLIAVRGRIMQALPSGAMLAVALSEKSTQPYLLTNPSLSLAAVNAPSQCVIAGSLEAIDVLENDLGQEGIACQRLPASRAFHSEMTTPVLETFTEQVRKISLSPPRIPFLSNVTGRWISDVEATDPSYWAAHLRRAVRFAEGLRELLNEPRCVLLEVGTGQTLCALAMQQQSAPVLTGQTFLPSLRQSREERSDMEILFHTLGKLWQMGIEIDWLNFHAGERRRRVPLPTYPFERQRYWLEPDAQRIEQKVAASTDDSISPVQAHLTLDAYPMLVTQEQDVESINRIEHSVASIWRELFGLEQIGLNDNFFALGGNSLLAIQLATRLRQTFQIELPMSDLFLDNPTVAELSKVIMKKCFELHLAEVEEQLDDVEMAEIDSLLDDLENIPPEQLQAMLRPPSPLTRGDNKDE